MGRVVATNNLVVKAPVDQVITAIADYAVVRPEILPEQYSAYRVLEGGQGAGTAARTAPTDGLHETELRKKRAALKDEIARMLSAAKA